MTKSLLTLSLLAVMMPGTSKAAPRSDTPSPSSQEPVTSVRTRQTLKEGWWFTRGELTAGSLWQEVRVPHDWAVYGPFDRENDIQVVAVRENGETVETAKTGRSGGLPFFGQGHYKTTFNVTDTTGRCFTLVFDGAMSNASVKVNGEDAGGWAYGYNSFHLDLDGLVVPGRNKLEVSLENKPESSRWYPGAGLYRNVHLVSTSKVHIPVWGTYITTPFVSEDHASVSLAIEFAGASKGEKLEVVTDILDPQGGIVATNRSIHSAYGQKLTQSFLIEKPSLWSTKSPSLYTARTSISKDGTLLDTYDTRFGIRSVQYIPEKGFFLNGEVTKFKGVCNHHDLGPLGAAVNRSGLRHQLELLKDMGCNAIRTSHNMPAPELVELCDEMGLMLMVEPFDDWCYRPKCANGYGSIFNEWAERDMVNMLRQFRNNPSVVMWSIGNEVPSQTSPDWVSELVFLQDICHREDPTRPVTSGMNIYDSVMDNGFAAALDIPGFNYKPQLYEEAYAKLPQKLVLGSETASTVSSRGVYHFPMKFGPHQMHDDHQSSSYDTDYCHWSNTPDIDFAMDEDLDFVIGQFVWTGFDYLGEPTPYDTDAWPSHSSLFGIIDLASLPKDRFYLYRSQWNEEEATLHVLPHWTWKGRVGQTTPVMVYTSYPKAELFVNGVSYGVREKDKTDLRTRYRLVWDSVVYQPGEIKVVAYSRDGSPAAEKVVKTAGKAHHIVLEANRRALAADGEDLVYVTVQVADKDGNIIPTDSRMVEFSVGGAGEFLATANGDPTCLLSFQEPRMSLFSGACTCIIRSKDFAGEVSLEVTSRGLLPATLAIKVE